MSCTTSLDFLIHKLWGYCLCAVGRAGICWLLYLNQLGVHGSTGYTNMYVGVSNIMCKEDYDFSFNNFV